METVTNGQKQTSEKTPFNFLASLINGNVSSGEGDGVVPWLAFNFLASLINGNCYNGWGWGGFGQPPFNFLASLINGNSCEGDL